MAKNPVYACQACGAVYNRWRGRCEACGGWNTVAEEAGGAGTLAGPAATRPARARGRVFPLEGLSGERAPEPRTVTANAEFDRVLGGGLVSGSVVLIGGDPGIGKSTLLIQISAALARGGHRVAYISGEEAVAQVRLRADRLGLADSPVELAAETNVEDIIATLGQGAPPRLAVIDSIQTMWTETIESAPGTVGQVRGSAQALIRFAKTKATALILVGHVTKDGQIAGPRVVEHMVDCVASFEGDS
ncbi:MAG: DNA repair protein RadA, partial [Methylobacteriaceae bacterium]|nr:DNA repair protein RadA [Methylobacteriaceae bacterium]